MRPAAFILAFTAPVWGGVVITSSVECSIGSVTVSDPQYCRLDSPGGGYFEARVLQDYTISGNEVWAFAATDAGGYNIPRGNPGFASGDISFSLSLYTAGPERWGWLYGHGAGGADGDYQTPSHATASGWAGPYSVTCVYQANCQQTPGVSPVPFLLGAPNGLGITAHAYSPAGGMAAGGLQFTLSIFEADGVTPVPVFAEPVPEPGTALLAVPLVAMAAWRKKR